MVGKSTSHVKGYGSTYGGAESPVQHVDDHPHQLYAREYSNNLHQHFEMGCIQSLVSLNLPCLFFVSRQNVVYHVASKLRTHQVEGNANQQQAHHPNGSPSIRLHQVEHPGKDRASADASWTDVSHKLKQQPTFLTALGIGFVAREKSDGFAIKLSVEFLGDFLEFVRKAIAVSQDINVDAIDPGLEKTRAYYRLTSEFCNLIEIDC